MLEFSNMSLICRRNSAGDSTQPWGAPVHGHIFRAKLVDSDLDAAPSEKAIDPLTITIHKASRIEIFEKSASCHTPIYCKHGFKMCFFPKRTLPLRHIVLHLPPNFRNIAG